MELKEGVYKPADNWVITMEIPKIAFRLAIF